MGKVRINPPLGLATSYSVSDRPIPRAGEGFFGKEIFLKRSYLEFGIFLRLQGGAWGTLLYGVFQQRGGSRIDHRHGGL